MKLATYLYEETESFGIVTDGGICDLANVFPQGARSVLELLQAGPAAVRKARDLASDPKGPLIPHDNVQLLAPVPNPPKILALAGNYVEHIRESRLGKGLTSDPANDTVPRPFLMPSTAITGPDAEIPWCAYSRDIDYEIELAVVISSPCKRVSPEQAKSHIFGYTIANDISARSTTFAQGRAERPWDEFYDWLNGKWADGFCPIGPYLVSADEIGDPMDLELELTVNGETKQKETTGNMIFNVYEIVSFISHLMTLTGGDIIATGTPSGVGMASGNFLKGGDVISARIEKIGVLTNTLGPAPSSFYAPCIKG